MIRWGILGAGNIAHRFGASLEHQPDSTLVAISGRNAEKMAAFAAQFKVRKIYLDHRALLADPDIDAIYLALPHGLHREWAVRALRAGKAVLCEKPATLNAAEMEEIAAVSRETGTLFMEAMKPRFVPLYGQLRTMLDKGVIGEITRVEASLCNAMPFDRMGNTYHTQPGQGGCLLDCGCYCASWLEDFLHGEPRFVEVETVEKDGLDHYVKAELRFGPATAMLECAFDRAKPRKASVYGTKGSIEVDELHRPQNMTVYVDGEAPRSISVPYLVDDFYGQIHAFTQCLQTGKAENEVMPLASSIRNVRILDVIRAGMGIASDNKQK